MKIDRGDCIAYFIVPVFVVGALLNDNQCTVVCGDDSILI